MAGELNQEQRTVVERLDDALLVLAPVGTGKTRVLAERALNAIHNGVPAERILCLTFTNRAAEQMRTRLRSYSEEAAEKATIRTFHSLCAWLLRTESRTLGIPTDFVIYDDVDGAELAAEIWQLSRADSREAMDVVGAIEIAKRRVPQKSLIPELAWEVVFASMDRFNAPNAMRYQSTLLQQHALDFADLILYTRLAFARDPEIRQRWSERFDFVQVDEVQDTNMAEYEIVRVLAENSRSVALIGDTDQTIYGWRGSEPERVLNRYRDDFSVTDFPLSWNYRATKSLLEAADRFACSFENRATHIVPAPGQSDGGPIRYHRAGDARDEGSWIATRIGKMSEGSADYPYHRVAVLGRTNQRAKTVAEALDRRGIPCVTVDSFQFFRRQEVKDAVAYLRLLTNPFDSYAARRAIRRPARGIGDATVRRIDDEGAPCGLRLTDMLSQETITRLDPLRPLLEAFDAGDVVVFDVETTGLAVEHDEVIEIAAVRLHGGKPADTFHQFLRNARPVGDSEAIHGHDDDFLRTRGRPPGEVLAEFMEFVECAHVVGHNVGFDTKMIGAQARRFGLSGLTGPSSDTWNIAERFVRSEDYRLGTLAKLLSLDASPTHKAPDDVATTVELLSSLIPLVREGVSERQRLVGAVGEPFAMLATQVAEWRCAMDLLRPAQLLERVLDESGLADHYSREPERLANLKRLVEIFAERDNWALHPETALRSCLEFASLAKNMDLVSETERKVAAITVHQAKGLEFDTVFIAGAVEDEMPTWFSRRDGTVEEERHLFYVALTRARERLFISGHALNEGGYNRRESEFLDDLDLVH